MRASRTFDLSTPAQGGQFRFSPLPPEGDGEAQRCQVTHPKVTQQIDSRAHRWPAGPGQAAFHSQGQFGHLALPRASSPGLLWELPGIRGGPLLIGEVGSGWGAALGTRWHPTSPGGRSSVPSTSASFKTMSCPEGHAPRQAFPPICRAESPKLTPEAQPSALETP